jgi:hypothetical protein
MTGFMLDTDISSYIIKRRPATLAEKFEKHAETLSVSAITAAELRFGGRRPDRNWPSWSRRTWNGSQSSTGPMRLRATMRGFALSWNVGASRSGIWISLLRHMRYPNI